jgi:hypothetical protein
MNLLQRYWINAASTHDRAHPLNGTNVLADLSSFDYPNTSNYVTVYFTKGAVISQLVPRIYLAKGWRKDGHKDEPPTSVAADCMMTQYNYLVKNIL